MKRSSLILTAAIFSVFLTVLVNSPAHGDIEVSPSSYDFGDVDVGTSSMVIVTTENIPTDCISCHGPLAVPHHSTPPALEGNCQYCHNLTPPEEPFFKDCEICHSTIQSIEFTGDSSPDFSITMAPSLPITILSGESADIEITYSPSTEGYASAVLQIGSNDHHNPLAEVSLGGVGAVQEPPPVTIEDTLAFYDESVTAGTLVGDGPGSSANGRLKALNNMLEATGDLIDGGYTEIACQQLLDAYKRCDGLAKPPDFVDGEARPALADMILDLMASFGCM